MQSRHPLWSPATVAQKMLHIAAFTINRVLPLTTTVDRQILVLPFAQRCAAGSQCSDQYRLADAKVTQLKDVDGY
jgi:hypothetical protein